MKSGKKGRKKGDRLLFYKFRRGLIYQTRTFKKSNLSPFIHRNGDGESCLV